MVAIIGIAFKQHRTHLHFRYSSKYPDLRSLKNMRVDKNWWNSLAQSHIIDGSGYSRWQWDVHGPDLTSLATGSSYFASPSHPGLVPKLGTSHVHGEHVGPGISAVRMPAAISKLGDQ